jgi:hypothetical protein
VKKGAVEAGVEGRLVTVAAAAAEIPVTEVAVGEDGRVMISRNATRSVSPVRPSDRNLTALSRRSLQKRSLP